MFQQSEAVNDDSFTSADWGLFVGVSMIWGSSFLLIAEALEGLTPGAVTLGRVGLGALTLIIIRAIRGNSVRIESSDQPKVLLLSLLWVAVPFTLFPLAQEHINSAVTGLLNGATPVFAGIVSALLVKVVPKGEQLLGIVIGFIGIVLISLGSSGGGSTEALGVVLVLGIAGLVERDRRELEVSLGILLFSQISDDFSDGRPFRFHNVVVEPVSKIRDGKCKILDRSLKMENEEVKNYSSTSVLANEPTWKKLSAYCKTKIPQSEKFGCWGTFGQFPFIFSLVKALPPPFLSLYSHDK